MGEASWRGCDDVQRAGQGNRRLLVAALGQRRALVTMNHIATASAPCREPPLTVLMGQDLWDVVSLADRCLKAGAVVIAGNGRPFTSASIGSAVATRFIMADLRAGMDGIQGGPAPFSKADRSRFLQALDEALVRMG